MEEYLKKAGEKALDIASQYGAEAEIFLLRERELGVGLEGQEVETLKQSEEIGVGVRIIKNGKIGFAYTTDLNDSSLKETISAAVLISNFSSSDETNILPRNCFSYKKLNLYNPEIAETSLIRKIDLLKNAQDVAFQYDQRIKAVDKVVYQENEFQNLIMNTHGLNAFCTANYCGIYVSLRSEDETDRQTGFAMNFKRGIDQLEPENVAKEAAHKAVRGLNPRSLSSGMMPCILESGVVVKLLGFLAASLGADAVQKGKSMLAGRLGETVASPLVNLIDDATYEEGLACMSFDGEGYPTRRNSLISRGILQGFLYNMKTAAKEKKESTGNGHRASFRSLPSVSSSNLFLLPGDDEPEKLINELGEGIYITDVLGMHTANPVTGDFSLGVAGIRITGGRLSYTVRGITLAGNILQLLKDIDGIGNDFRFFGSRGASTVRVSKVSIGGE